MTPDADFLRHALEAIERIAELVAGGKPEFLRDWRVQDSMIRQFEVIGEAFRLVSVDLRATHPQIPWAKVIALRNRLIHGYFEVQLDLLWQTAVDSAPALKAQIEAMLQADER